jgi:hypothetical protein
MNPEKISVVLRSLHPELLVQVVRAWAQVVPVDRGVVRVVVRAWAQVVRVVVRAWAQVVRVDPGVVRESIFQQGL